MFVHGRGPTLALPFQWIPPRSKVTSLRCGDSVLGLSVGTRCWDSVLELGVGTVGFGVGTRCGDSVLGLGDGNVGTRCGNAVSVFGTW